MNTNSPTSTALVPLPCYLSTDQEEDLSPSQKRLHNLALACFSTGALAMGGGVISFNVGYYKDQDDAEITGLVLIIFGMVLCLAPVLEMCYYACFDKRTVDIETL